jgi:hypothetical protein
LRHAHCLLGLAVGHSFPIEVPVDSDLVSRTWEHGSLHLQELRDDPGFVLELKKSLSEDILVDIGWLLDPFGLHLLVLEHDVEEEGEDLASVFDIGEEEGVEGDVVVVIQSLQVLGYLLAESEFVS